MKAVDEAANLEFDGILAYESHVKAEAETESEFDELC